MWGVVSFIGSDLHEFVETDVGTEGENEPEVSTSPNIQSTKGTAPMLAAKTVTTSQLATQSVEPTLEHHYFSFNPTSNAATIKDFVIYGLPTREMMRASRSTIPEEQPKCVGGGPATTKVYAGGKDAEENESFIPPTKFNKE